MRPGASLGASIALAALGVHATASAQGAAPTVVIKANVVTPGAFLSPGWVVIKEGRIAAVSSTAPQEASAIRIETADILAPGFVDLHNHPMYSAFPRWQPAQRFNNRYGWRDLMDYKKLIGDPGRALQNDDDVFCAIDQMAELRGLIGGTTSSVGISARRPPLVPVPTCISGLQRNLDWSSGFYSAEPGHERLASILGIAPRDLPEAAAAELRGKLGRDELDVLLVHVAEGLPSDLESSLEFSSLKGRGLLGRKTAVVHGVAFGKQDFKEMHDVGASLVWSPHSNFNLYGATTDVQTAYHEGVSIALAPDWSPTGSTTMLEELQYAASHNADKLHGTFSDRQLFEMATSTPARIARMDDRIGAIQVGLYGDLFLLRGDTTTPYRSLLQAAPQDVELVLVNGVPLYGTDELLRPFGARLEQVSVCGSARYVAADALPAGSVTQMVTKIKAAFSKLSLTPAPLVECDKKPDHPN